MRVLILAAVALAAAPLLAQSQKADRRPDLDGVWNFATLTPLERPSQYADKPVLTDAEAEVFEREALQRNDADRRPPAGSDADVALAYNNAWYDRGSKVVGTRRTSIITDPPDGRIPALTAEGQRRATLRADARRQHGPADGPEDRSLAERCLLFGAGPPMLPGPYNNNVQIVQTRDYVVISNEMIHDARIVPLNAGPRLPGSVRRWQGDPRGHWDGDVLVVDTTNFSDRTNLRGSDEQLHLVERFRRVDANTLLYEFTVDDPTAFTKSWSGAIPMTRSTESIYEYACHEANYAMGGILRGARAQEKQ
ncbi:MAG TPA: hypothetical protein VGG73_17620 [Vicinamibacterales bacterium]